MKLLIAFLFCATFAHAQSSSSQQPHHYGYVTPNKDTLYLANNDVGKVIEEFWFNETRFDKPIIIMVDVYVVDEMNRTKSTRKSGTRYIVQQ